MLAMLQIKMLGVFPDKLFDSKFCRLLLLLHQPRVFFVKFLNYTFVLVLRLLEFRGLSGLALSQIPLRSN